jgi:cbb3-type cytochrome c oxidase subunit III
MKTSVVASCSLLIAAFAVGPALANETAAAPKLDLARGQEISTTVCMACHSNDGSRGTPAYPILQGQHPEYLVKQLTEFKSGKRANAIMAGMAATLSEADMKNVAAFYASKQAKAGASKDAEAASLGEKIYRGGIADRQVPACAGCHSPNGAGIPAQYPRLSGQHGDYVEGQMNAFRSGARGNSVQMMAIAARLSDKEIKAVSDYVTGLH